MTETAQTEISQLQETIRSLQETNRSLQFDVMALENSYNDEIKKSHGLKRQIFSMNSDIESLKKQLTEKLERAA